MKPLTLSPGLGDHRPTATLYYGQDVRKTLQSLDEASVHTVCTSPPYWGLRDYGTGDKQIGLEESPQEFVESLVEVFREIKRVLRPDGTLWLNLGDSYAGGERAGLKAKDLVGIPWRVAFALQADGWYLRSAAPWIKGNCMPESCTDRPTTATEYIFLFAHPDSGGKYFYDIDAVRKPHRSSGYVTPWQHKEYNQSILPEAHQQNPGKYGIAVKGRPKGIAGFGEGGRNRRDTDTWNEMLEASAQELLAAQNNYGIVHNAEGDPLAFKVNLKPYKGSHFATWPPDLVRPMILAGCPAGGTVLDPFSGSATTGMVALREGRNYVGIDLNPDYLGLAQARIEGRKAPQPVEPDSGHDIFDLFGG